MFHSSVHALYIIIYEFISRSLFFFSTPRRCLRPNWIFFIRVCIFHHASVSIFRIFTLRLIYLTGAEVFIRRGWGRFSGWILRAARLGFLLQKDREWVGEWVLNKYVTLPFLSPSWRSVDWFVYLKCAGNRGHHIFILNSFS